MTHDQKPQLPPVRAIREEGAFLGVELLVLVTLVVAAWLIWVLFAMITNQELA